MTETKFDRLVCNEVEEVLPYQLSIFRKTGKPIEKASFKQLSYDDWELVQLYVLKNYNEAETLLE